MPILLFTLGSLVAGGLVSSTSNFTGQIVNVVKEHALNRLRHPAANQAAQAVQAIQEVIAEVPAIGVPFNQAVPAVIMPAHHGLVAHPLRDSIFRTITRKCYIWGCENIGSLSIVGVSYLLFINFRGATSRKAIKANAEILRQLQIEAARAAAAAAQRTTIGMIIISTIFVTIAPMKLVEMYKANRALKEQAEKAKVDSYNTIEATTNKKRERT